MESEKEYSLQEVSELSGLSERTIRRYIKFCYLKNESYLPTPSLDYKAHHSGAWSLLP